MLVQNIKLYNISYINNDTINTFKTVLASTNWDSLNYVTNANDAYDLFIDRFTALYNNCFPIVVRVIRNTEINHKPWITPEILKSIKRKMHCIKKAFSQNRLPC